MSLFTVVLLLPTLCICCEQCTAASMLHSGAPVYMKCIRTICAFRQPVMRRSRAALQVYMFGHRDANTPLPVIELSVRQAGGSHAATLTLSARHFIPAASNGTATAISTYAKDVQPGDAVTMIVNDRPAVATVTAKRITLKQGAFNPYTRV
jgi:hypothetical protein